MGFAIGDGVGRIGELGFGEGYGLVGISGLGELAGVGELGSPVLRGGLG